MTCLNNLWNAWIYDLFECLNNLNIWILTAKIIHFMRPNMIFRLLVWLRPKSLQQKILNIGEILIFLQKATKVALKLSNYNYLLPEFGSLSIAQTAFNHLFKLLQALQTLIHLFCYPLTVRKDELFSWFGALFQHLKIAKGPRNYLLVREAKQSLALRNYCLKILIFHHFALGLYFRLWASSDLYEHFSLFGKSLV